MKIARSVATGLFLATLGTLFAGAQEMPGPPKVLQITREFIKPGKAGAIHDRSESNFVTAMANAKWPTHYFAVNSLSGKVRALYFTGYDSFAAWEKDDHAVMKDKALTAELDKASVNDGELLDGMDQFVFTYDPDLSLNPTTSFTGVRYLEITSVHVKIGHQHEFHELAQMFIDGNKKAGTSAHWDAFEIAYGGGDEYILVSPDKSMAEIDTSFAEDKQFRDALGEDGMKKLGDLEKDCLESASSELFSINPAQSYPPEEWVKADPDFWKASPAVARPAAKAAAPAAKKPAQ
jgi:hypothetical protein